MEVLREICLLVAIGLFLERVSCVKEWLGGLSTGDWWFRSVRYHPYTVPGLYLREKTLIEDEQCTTLVWQHNTTSCGRNNSVSLGPPGGFTQNIRGRSFPTPVLVCGEAKASDRPCTF